MYHIISAIPVWNVLTADAADAIFFIKVNSSNTSSFYTMFKGEIDSSMYFTSRCEI